jgi:PAS domain S-box-containing protein
MAKEAPEKTTYLMIRALRNPHLWVVAVMMALLVIVHYHEVFADVPVLERIGSVMGLGLTRGTLWRILFLVPVTYGAVMLGIGGGLSILILAAIAMLPRVFLISPAPREALFETGGVVLIGALIVLLSHSSQRGRQRLSELEATQSMLNLQIKRLGMLYATSSLLSQSLEPGHCLAVMDKVEQLMGVESTWLYLWDGDKKKLGLATSSGLSKALAQELGLGEGLDGMVAQSRQPIVIEDVSANPIFRSASLRPDDLQSIVIVPLISKGEIMGTLGVGTRLVHHFPPDEVDLLRTIGDQISMTVENARLYEKERFIAEALRVSERNYRELFENAGDAIWVHDLSGIIMAANSAFERLAGYKRDALVGANVSMLLSSHGVTKVDKEAHHKVLRGEAAEPYEQELVRKDGSVVVTQLGTSLITKDGQPWAFQHIARDITEAKRTQDNLRFYVQQVSQAQEAERKRIARELHDVTAQALVAVSRNLEKLASGNSQVSIKDIREEVRSILQEVRRFGQQLRPSILDDLGLLPAVKWLVSELTKNYGIATDIEVLGEACQLLPEAELMLFRIVQEALTNVRRHSGADKVCVRVEFADHATRITVSDNGKGFEMPTRVGDLARTGKLGLAGMQERAQLLGGTLVIGSKPGKGTTLTVEVPLPGVNLTGKGER